MRLILPDFVARLRLAGDKITGDRRVDRRARDLHLTNLLLSAIHIQALLGRGQAPDRELHDDKTQDWIDRGNATVNAWIQPGRRHFGFGGGLDRGRRRDGDRTRDEHTGIIGEFALGGRRGATAEEKRTQETDHNTVHEGS
jgi:hypothetical protein